MFVVLLLLLCSHVGQSRRLNLKQRLQLGQQVQAGCSSHHSCTPCLNAVTRNEAIEDEGEGEAEAATQCAWDWVTSRCLATDGDAFTALDESVDTPSWRLAKEARQCLDGKQEGRVANRFLSVAMNAGGKTGGRPEPSNFRAVIPPPVGTNVLEGLNEPQATAAFLEYLRSASTSTSLGNNHPLKGLDYRIERVYILSQPLRHIPNMVQSASKTLNGNQMMHSGVLARIQYPGLAKHVEMYVLFELSAQKKKDFGMQTVIQARVFQSTESSDERNAKSENDQHALRRTRLLTAYRRYSVIKMKNEDAIFLEGQPAVQGEGTTRTPVFQEREDSLLPFSGTSASGKRWGFPLQHTNAEQEDGTTVRRYPATLGNALRWSINYLFKYPFVYDVSFNCQRYAYALNSFLTSTAGPRRYPNPNIADTHDSAGGRVVEKVLVKAKGAVTGTVGLAGKILGGAKSIVSAGAGLLAKLPNLFKEAQKEEQKLEDDTLKEVSI